MRRIQESLILVLIAFVAAGLVHGQGRSTPQDADGGEPENVECDEDEDGECTDTRGSGAGPSELFCFCKNPVSEAPGGGEGLSALQLWIACEEVCFESHDGYLAEPDPNGGAGLQISRDDGGALEGVCGWDNIFAIQGWNLEIDTAGRIGKFKKMTWPGPGLDQSIYFKINDRDFYVSWFGRKSAPQVNALVIAALEANHFEVAETEDFILVLSDLGNDGGSLPVSIHTFNIRYTPGTKLNELYLALEPMNTEDRLLCLTGGLGE